MEEDDPPIRCPDDGGVLQPTRDGLACPECGYWSPFDDIDWPFASRPL
jgi:hypothetical protein